MNYFYNLPEKTQRFWSRIALIIYLVTCLGWMVLMTKSLLWILLIFVLVPLQHLTLTPSFRLSGTYEYLSPMLLVFMPNDEVYDLHNGTSFDYYWVMKGVKMGRPMRNKTLMYYFEGLLQVVDKIEEGTLPSTVTIKGCSYFFSDRTANRLGFKLTETTLGERVNILMNYLDLIWMYSLSRGKLSFPRISTIKTATIKGEELLKQKETLESYHAYFTRSTIGA